MGREGLDRTLRALRRAGIASVGSGANSRTAPGPFRFTRGGVRFAVLSFSGIGEAATFSTTSRPGVAAMRDARIHQRVRAARRGADQLIVSLHWGNEYYARPDRRQVALARSLIDAGATAVIGHHPHVPQGVEIYRGRVICYSLGNFLFGSINEDQTENILLQLEIDPQKKRHRTRSYCAHRRPLPRRGRSSTATAGRRGSPRILERVLCTGSGPLKETRRRRCASIPTVRVPSHCVRIRRGGVRVPVAYLIGPSIGSRVPGFARSASSSSRIYFNSASRSFASIFGMRRMASLMDLFFDLCRACT